MAAQQGIAQQKNGAARCAEMDEATLEDWQLVTHWASRIALAVGWFGFGWAVVVAMRTLGLSPQASQLSAYVLGLGVLAIGVEMVWRRPAPIEYDLEPARRRISFQAKSWLVTIFFVVLWLTWVAGALRLFWLVLFLVAVPYAVMQSHCIIRSLLVAPDAELASVSTPSLTVTLIERGFRALLILVGIILLAHLWRLDLSALASSDSTATRFARGILSAAAILLVADFLWQLMRTAIDATIRRSEATGSETSEELLRKARLRTLLPIVRNILMIVLAAMVILMSLSSLGVEIGPLLAGAGVIGVAVGFGAQTVVKDIISGMFYLLDDAFRVGEYIESGSFKGTVESFSLRSVKLRHHRGSIYIVPFGELGAVQNMSRDWVIDKMMLGITYDFDIEKARKLIKKIGFELAEDPEFKDKIIESLKMQGVDNFGDYAVQLRLKLKTKPGEQFPVRRRALVLIKKAFEENGIKFASPTVKVAGGSGDAELVAAQQVINAGKVAAVP